MRTLDEVIKAVEEDLECANVSYPETFYDYDNHKDALYYLKEYRSDMQMYAANQKHWEDELQQKIKDFGDAKDRYIARLKELDIGTLNEPLTWDELRTMEGKPVWFESENYYEEYQIGEKDCPIKYDKEECWVIIDKVMSGTVKFKRINGRILKGWRRVKGKAWEAYRKERS